MDAMGVGAVASREAILAIIAECKRVIIKPQLLSYISQIVTRTRDWPGIAIGASPRASVALLMGSRACAATRGREYVTPDDVLRVAPWSLRHRIRLTPDAVIQETKPDDILNQIFDSVEVPRG